MERVTLETLDAFLKRYGDARGGKYEENTYSEAAFVFVSRDRGAYGLHVTFVSRILWIGLQNASTYWSDKGLAFKSIVAALRAVLRTFDSVDDPHGGLFYNEDSAARLRFVAEQIERYKKEA